MLFSGFRSPTNMLRSVGFLLVAGAVLLLGLAPAVYGQATLQLSTQQLTFNNVGAGTLSAPLEVKVWSSLSTTLHIDTSGSPGWLTVLSPPFPNIDGSTFPVDPNDPDDPNAHPLTLNVRVNAGQLTEGTYVSSFIVKVNGTTQGHTVTVTANITGTSLLSANPTSLQFTAVQGGLQGSPVSAAVQIASAGAPLNYALLSSVSEGNWLLLNTTSGTTGGAGFVVSVNPGSLLPGVYQGSITADSVSTTDMVQIAVTLTVNADASLTVSPATPVTFLHQVGQAAPAPKTLEVNSSGGAVTFTVGLGSAANWLVVNPLNGTAGPGPASLTLNVNPAGLAPGVYTTSVIVDPSNGPALAPVAVKLVVSINPLLQITSTSLGFSAPFGGAAPQAQNVTVSAQGTGGPVGFSLSASQPWVTVQPSSNQTVSTLAVSVNPEGLTIGKHAATITITPNNGDSYTREIQVTLTVVDSAELTVGPGALLFSHQLSGATPQAQTVLLRSGGQPVAFTLATPTLNCGSWLSASANQSTTPAILTVSVNVAGMTPGLCRGMVEVRFLSGQEMRTVTLPVSVAVKSEALLSVSLPQGFGMITIQQGQLPPAQTITLTSTTPGNPVNYNITTTSTGGSWLQSSGAGITPQNGTINYFTGTLSPGLYSGEVTISSPSLPGESFVIPVLVRILPNITVTVSSNVVTFTQPQGGTPPAAQTITMTPTAPGATFTAAVEFLSGSNWLAIDRTSGAASGAIELRVLQNSLPTNFYSARVRLAFQNAATPPVEITVVLSVTQARTLTSSANSLQFSYQQGSAVPAAQQLNISSSPADLTFSVGTTSTGGWLTATPLTGAAPAAITVTVNPAGLVPGTYSGSLSISASGTTPLTVSVTLTVSGAPPPEPITITSNASGVAGAIAPGQIVTIKGSSLGPASPASGVLFQLAGNGSVPNTLAGVRVLFDQIPGTPIYVSSTQINVTVPYEVAGRITVSVVVESQGVRSLPITVRLENAAPGIYTLDSTGIGQAAAINQNGTFNGPGLGSGPLANTTPAAIGHAIVLYATGGGQTGPASITGSVTPTSLPLRMIPGTVTATIGGMPATVEFAGAAPGLVTGVIQFNLRPHPSVHGNALSVTVTINGATSPLGPTVAVQ